MNKLIQNFRSKFSIFQNIRQNPLALQMRQEVGQKEVVSEALIKQILKQKFSPSSVIEVEDVSGGCGAMFNVCIESSDFKSLSIPKQHRIVYDILKEQISNIHGLHLVTKTPPNKGT